MHRQLYFDSKSMTSDETVNVENLNIFRETDVHYINCQFPTNDCS
jgi:hypothetical protein